MNAREGVLLAFLVITVALGLSGMASRQFFDMLRPAWDTLAIIIVLFMFATGEPNVRE